MPRRERAPPNVGDALLFQAYLADIGLLARELSAVPPGRWVVLDEIQRLPALLNEEHRFIEDRRLQFVLLGSSARKLKQSGTNLLAGRALRRIMLPLVPEELGADFELDRVLRWGSLPVIWQSADPQDSLQAYVHMYLKEEIQAEALVRNLPGFARFLPVAALFHGQVLNVASLARDAGVARSTVAGYLDILADTHLAWLVPGFEAKLRVKERQHPKLYWVDPGVVRAVRRDRHAPTPAERGSLFEGWVATLLRTYGDPDFGLGARTLISGNNGHVHRASISEAKNGLSALIDRVRQGESIIIEDRGVPVARLESVVAPGKGASIGRAARLLRQGILRPASAPTPKRVLAEGGPVPKGGARLSDTVIAERRPPTLTFVTLDERLAGAAQKEGFVVDSSPAAS
ncbi:MAG: type II toxin-antitoxin system prevent-host-death family antitoxin [Acidobacteriota bacterium]